MSTPLGKDFEVRLLILFGPLGLHDYILLKRLHISYFGLFLFFLPSPSPHIPVKESKKIFKDKKKTDRQKDRNKARDRYRETHLSLFFLLFFCRSNVCPLMLSSSF